MTQADHCIHCMKPDKPPSIQSYYGVNGHHWAHPVCEHRANPMPETTFTGRGRQRESGMSFKRQQVTRIDANQPEIVKALEAAGCDVEIIGRPVDLLVRRRSWGWAQNMWMLMEVKDATKTGRTYTMQPAKAAKMKRQLDFIAVHNVPVVTSPEQALQAVGL